MRKIIIIILLFKSFILLHAEEKSFQQNVEKENSINEKEAISGEVSSGENESDSENDGAPKKFIIIPVAYYTPETSAAIGVVSVNNYNEVSPGKTSHIQFVGAYTAKKQTILKLTPKFYFSDGSKELYGKLYYAFYPSKYFGENGEYFKKGENYIENTLTAQLGGAHEVWPHFFGRVLFEQDNKTLSGIDDEGVLKNKISTTDREYQSFSTQISLEWDTRLFPNSPIAGEHVRVSFAQVQLNSHENYVKSLQKREIELKKYWPIAETYTLAGQFFMGSQSQTEVPFFYQYTIGGSSQIRGCYYGERHDANLMLNQWELRKQLNSRFNITGFVGLSKLSEDLANIGGTETIKSFGAGLGYFIDPRNRLKIRLDIGVSDTRSGVYFVMGESF